MATSTRARTTATIAAALGALALVSAMVVRTSQATFTATTDNQNNSFATGELNLSDDAATAMFSVTAMEPGQSENHCITVTYDGTIPDPSGVKVYAAGAVTDPDGVGDQLNLTIEEAASCAGTFASTYTGTVSDFVATHTNYGNGVGTWDPSAVGQTQAYRFTVELDSAADDTFQGTSLTDLGFTWEIRN
jgi:hypothetical protein